MTITVKLGAPWRHLANVAPAYGSVLGTVTRNGIDTGALILVDETGLYSQLNAGAMRSLPQAEVQAAIAAAEPGTRGGARPNSGPKPADGKRGDRFNVTVDEGSAEVLRSYGDGQLSLGIRRAALLVLREVGVRDEEVSIGIRR